MIKAQTMSMFNFDGQIVAGVLQTQQAGEVFRGILENRAAMKAEEMQQQQLSANQQRHAGLVAKYNNLADRYNGVLADNKKVDAAYAEALAEKDRQIARLTAEGERLASEKEEFRRIGYETCDKLSNALDEIKRLKIKAGELQPDERKSDGDH
jgi:chromosome segregation ATPase